MSNARPKLLINALSVTVGGGRSYATNAALEFDRDDRGFDVTLLVSPGSLDDLQLDRVAMRVAGIPNVPQSLRRIWRVLYELTVVPQIARNYDLLYCIGDISPPVSPIPTVTALVNLNIYDRRFYDNLRLRTLRILALLGMRNAARVVFPTAAAGDQIAATARIPAGRGCVVPHGISLDSFEGVEPESSQRPFVFLPSAIERHKNIESLVRAVPHLRNPDLEVWIAGAFDTDPTYAKELRDLVSELNVDDRVRFLGPVPYERIQRYYRGATALVFPSRLETFGFPIVEAMLAGTPIVASDIPTFRELANDAALFFPPMDEIALARAIDEISEDPSGVQERLRIGHERVKSLSWRHSIDTLSEVFLSALAESDRGSRA